MLATHLILVGFVGQLFPFEQHFEDILVIHVNIFVDWRRG